MRVTDGKVPENAALIDRYGRLIVKEKPFMPVGAFATLDGNLEKQVGRLQEAGLNSVIGYCNFAMKAAPAKKTQQEVFSLLWICWNAAGSKVFSVSRSAFPISEREKASTE
ncbi:MAG: hypothetical protein V8T87_08000 [Victivallales bacterium]